MRLGRRITFHFLFQVIVTFTAIFLMFLLVMIGIVLLITQDEMKTNPHKAIIENLPVSALINGDDDIEIAGSWENTLKENQMWMQLMNQDGKVVHELNTPKAGLPHQYTLNELLQIEETKELGPYQIATYYDSWQKEPYYYLFGFIEENQQFLDKLFHTYSDENGMVPKEKLPTITSQLAQQDAVIEIFQDGESKQLIGKDNTGELKNLDVLGRMHEPGNYRTKAYSYTDTDNQIAWTLYIKNEEFQASKLHFFVRSELQILITATAISLFIALTLSIWHGYRYGKPLLMLIQWLDFMEDRNYQEVLKGKEHKRIYKKNGKVKLRYRLYKEVFQSLTNLTNKLFHAEKERMQLEKTREEWMTGISHDLRTPLSSIQGYGHMLESDQYDFSRDELQQIGQVIRNQSDYMVNLVNDFSLIFQLKNSTIAIEKSTVDMHTFVEKIVRTYQQDIQWQQYSLVLLPTEVPVKAKIDPIWFTRVLDNLLANALKHNPPGTKIQICLRHVAENTVIQIIDNGKGMEPEVVNNLFNRYYKGTSTHTRTEGEGLGMSIANAIVDLHGGELAIDSTIGAGTTITITLSDHEDEK